MFSQNDTTNKICALVIRTVRTIPRDEAADDVPAPVRNDAGSPNQREMRKK